MLERKSWDEFRETKLLWFINRLIHTFGWTIVMDIEVNNGGEEEVKDCYPARTKFRGFDKKSEEEGFIGLTKYLKENIDELDKEVNL